MSLILQQLNDELAAVVEKVRRSLVQVQNGRSGAGAGTLLHADGLIVTNAHVVQRRQPQVILWDGRTLPAQLLAYDETADLAALAIEATDLPTLEIAQAADVRPGQWVVALGHPWGVTGAVTAGMVIGLGRPPEMPRYPGDLLQVDLHLRPGHSGGPMVDGHGRLVGINTMIAGPNVGLAVPTHTVKRFLKQALGTPAAGPTGYI
jgi:serine protease Do